MTGQPKTDPLEFQGELVRTPWFYRQWMIAGNPAYFFDRLVDDFGDFVHYRGLFSFYLLNHPALVKRVLKATHKSFDKNSIIYNRFRNAFGDGLVVAEGDHWKRQRRQMQPMFGPVTIRRFFDIMLDETESLADRWMTVCQNGQVFDIAPQMNELTLAIAGRSLFSDGFDEVSNQISHWTETINRYSGRPPLRISGQLWFPTPTNLRLKRALRQFHAFLRNMIAARRGQGVHDDLLTILLQARDEESGQAMTDLEIAEEALGMIIGGHETSSSALAWIFYELDKSPEIQSRLQSEIDSVIGTQRLSLADVPKLTYTKMIIDEALRLHPPFWFENRNAMQDVELGGHIIPKGSMVAFSRYSLHRHPGFWREPEVFDPERFAPESEENKRSTYACVPFGGGPRICIGIHFATMELIVVLAVIAQRYNVVVDQSDRHIMGAKLTMTPKHGVKVRLLRR